MTLMHPANTTPEQCDASDETLSTMLNLADEVLREHDLLRFRQFPKRTVIEHPELTGIFYQFRLNVYPFEAADMNVQLAAKLAEKLVHISSAYHVSFFGLRA
jgi:hypothetical protein